MENIKPEPNQTFDLTPQEAEASQFSPLTTTLINVLFAIVDKINMTAEARNNLKSEIIIRLEPHT